MKRKPVDLNGIRNSTVTVGGEHDDHYASTTTVLNGTVWIIVDCHSRVLVIMTQLAEWSLTRPEAFGSNPVIGEIP